MSFENWWKSHRFVCRLKTGKKVTLSVRVELMTFRLWDWQAAYCANDNFLRTLLLPSLWLDPHCCPSVLLLFILPHPGCPADEDNQECTNPFDIFQGCMRLLSVDNQPVDLILVQQRLLGNYSHLQIDMCGIMDRSESQKRLNQPPCLSRQTSSANHFQTPDLTRSEDVPAESSWSNTRSVK